MLLVPTSSVNNRFGKCILKTVGQEVKLNSVPFKGYKKGNTYDVSLLYLLTPEMWSYVSYRKMSSAQRQVNYPQFVDSVDPGMVQTLGKKEELHDIALRLLDQGCSSNVIHKLTHLSHHDIKGLEGKLHSFRKEQDSMTL